MNNEILLSILIPTYNGASKFLDRTMYSLIEGMNLCEEGMIEVIVSSNASTDNTLEYMNQYRDFPFIKCYSNETNIGFARNIVRLTDEYACGKYGWVIGDDDVIIPNALPAIVNELKKGVVDYLSLGFKFVRGEDDYPTGTHDYEIHYSTFAEALEQEKKGNILGTFMSSSIMRLSLFKSIDKNAITPVFDTFQSIFPNGYINATAYYDKPCAFITEEVVMAFMHDKGWNTEDNNYKIRFHAIPDLYNYMISLGLKKRDLKNSYKAILYEGMYCGYSRLFKGKSVDGQFFYFLRKSLSYPMVHVALIKRFISSFGRRLYRV